MIVVGNGSIGKTSLIQKFAKGVFTEQYKKTIGVDFLERTTFVPALQQDVTLFLWDTAGQEEFDAVTRSYYRGTKTIVFLGVCDISAGAGACVIAFSTTDRDSFNDVPKWKRKVEAECGRIPMVLIQNKIDLIDEAKMTAEEAEKTASDLGLRFYRTCVKENVNVNEGTGGCCCISVLCALTVCGSLVFLYLAEQFVHSSKEQALTQPVASIGMHYLCLRSTIGC